MTDSSGEPIAVSATDSSVTLARQTLLLGFGICFACILLLAGGCLTARVHVLSAAEQLQRSTVVADEILLADERATNAIRMAMATQDPIWISKYAEAAARIELAISRASTLAPLNRMPEFADVIAANNHLLKLEGTAFALLKAGNTAEAKEIIEGTTYIAQKSVIAEGILSLRSRLIDSAQREWAHLKAQSRWLTAGIIAVVAATLLLVLWRLTVILSASQRANRASADQLKWMAMHDPLTGLANRWRFIEEKQRYKQTLEKNEKVAVFILDVDRFKPINDCYGHRIGDEVLKVVAARISQVALNGLVARIGGDEFGILLPFSGDERQLTRLAGDILEAVKQPIRLSNLCIKVGISIGFTICTADNDEQHPLVLQDGCGTETTFRRADMALHAAKEKGRGCYHRFEAEMDRKLFERVELESEIESAIERGQIVPYYQPLIDLRSGRVVGLEVLARWRHPTKGLIPPSLFIPAAESTGTIGMMTCHLLRRAIGDAAAWPEGVVLSINISPAQFSDSWLAGQILAITNQTHFSPRLLEVEVTEEALIGNLAEASSVFKSLRSLGVRTALDDFGAGYAGVRYLREFKFDRLKIDRSFIRDLSKNPEEEQVVKALVRLARALKMEAVAEGIEDRPTCEGLLKIGCHLGQGYFFSEPRPASETARFFHYKDNQLVA